MQRAISGVVERSRSSVGVVEGGVACLPVLSTTEANICFLQRGRNARQTREHVLTDARSSASSARRSMILSSISRGKIELVDMRMRIRVRRGRL